jgi:arginine/lysine/ornithine decarboxylase
MKHTNTPLFSALKDYTERKVLPFDVPGHKHGKGASEMVSFFGSTMLEADVNSMPCLDNLSNPVGVIKEAEDLLADAYSASNSFFIVNGSTSGVQCMLLSACEPGDKILLPRNVHKSAINGLILSGAVPVYISPCFNEEHAMTLGVETEATIRMIELNPDAKAILLLNPTYYGVTSDLEKIIEVAHLYDIAVLVDEAHGSHFPFHKDLPKSAMHLGADMSTISLHKTGGSLTQSSAVLLNEGLIRKKRVREILNLTQSTSASYLLMSSIDLARKNLVLNGPKFFSGLLEVCRHARKRLNDIPGIKCFGKELLDLDGVHDFDETKLGINVSGMGLTGFEVYDLLIEHYNIQLELADMYNVLAIISLGDDKNSVGQLVEALRDIQEKFSKDQGMHYDYIMHIPELVVSPREAFYARKKKVSVYEAVGEVSGESIMIYPPGIPIVSPGERITAEIVDYLLLLREVQGSLTDSEDPEINYIKVIEK